MIRVFVMAAALAVGTVFCGCKTTDASVGDGPVAPQFQSNEKSQSGEPSLPYLKPWWMN